MSRKFISIVSIIVLVVTLLAPVGVQDVSARSDNYVDRVVTVKDDTYLGKDVSAPNLIIENDNNNGQDWEEGQTFRLSLPSNVKWMIDTNYIFNNFTNNPVAKISSKISEQTIEITTIETIKVRESIIVPLLVKFDGAEGEVRVTVDSRDSQVSSGSYTFATAYGSETITYLNKKPLQVFDGHIFTSHDVIKLSIYESHAGLLNNGDIFRIILPSGVKWSNDVINNMVGGLGSILDQQTLQIEVQKEQYSRASIEIPLLVSIDGFEGELQAHIFPMGSRVTEEKITFAYVSGVLSINDTITFPKAKVKLSNFRYGYTEEDGYKLAKIDIETWIEEEPPNKIDWYVPDFFTKWILNDGREILGDYNIEGTDIVKVKQWKKSTIVFRIKDYQEVTGIYIVDPLNNNNIVKVHFEEAGQDNPIDKNPPAGGGGGGGGSISPSNEQTVSVGKSNTIKLNGVTITIPANALSENARIKVVKVSNTSNLPVPSNMQLVGNVYEITKNIKGNFDHNITITLPFKKTEYDTEKYDLVVCWFNEETHEWVPLDNIQIELENGTVSGEVNHFTKFAVFAIEKDKTIEEEIIEEAVEEDISVKISDIAGHWAEEGINTLINLGAIEGYADRTFKPNNSITRAEFVSMLVKVFELEYVNGKVFDDTLNHWGKDAITTAQVHGIVSGYNEDIFGSDDLITREQMASMIIKVLDLENKELSKTYLDDHEISNWARDSLVIAVENGIISGYPDHTLRPQNNATRAEAVTIIVRAMNSRN